MNPLQQPSQQLQLASGKVFSDRFGDSRLVSVRRGLVWITQEGRAEDFWLGAGEGIIVLPQQLVVIEAALASELDLEYRPESGLAAWLRRRGRICSAALRRSLARFSAA